MALFRRKHVIDVRDSQDSRAFGQPVACPDCGGVGFLDRIDVRNRIMFQHCVRCGYVYQTTEADIATEPKVSPA